MKKAIGTILLAVSSLLHAQTLDFDTAPTSGICEIPWMEEGLLMIAQGTQQDPSNCWVEILDGEMLLAPGQVRVDITGLDITRIEADIRDGAGQGATRLFVLHENGQIVAQTSNQAVAFPETLALNNVSGQFLVVEGFETFLTQIRITASAPEPEITIDTNPSNQPAGTFLVCWPSGQLERSRDMVVWEAVPESETEDHNGGLCHPVNSLLNSRYFYRFSDVP